MYLPQPPSLVDPAHNKFSSVSNSPPPDSCGSRDVGPPKKVLIADDSAVVHRIFLDALRDVAFPITLLHALDGEKCLRILEKVPVDLAFIDIEMPHINGVEALYAARNRGSRTFVTLISGQADERCIEAARELGVYELLLKPFDASHVLSVLATYRRLITPLQALVVDDSLTVRRVIRKVLAHSLFRMEIDEIADGSTAIERCRARPADVVFLDYNMPRLNGSDAMETILRDNPATKVVMISGERNSDREREWMQRGAAAFLPKPFSASDVDLLLHRLNGLQPPRLKTEGVGLVAAFAASIQGRTISVEHKRSGRVFQFVWFRDPPHLRSTVIRECDGAPAPIAGTQRAAEGAAVAELRNAKLIR